MIQCYQYLASGKPIYCQNPSVGSKGDCSTSYAQTVWIPHLFQSWSWPWDTLNVLPECEPLTQAGEDVVEHHMSSVKSHVSMDTQWMSVAIPSCPEGCGHVPVYLLLTIFTCMYRQRGKILIVYRLRRWEKTLPVRHPLDMMNIESSLWMVRMEMLA